MVRERFDDSFERLREQSNRLANLERSGDNFDEIVEQRVELDRLRDEVTNERKNIVSRYEPPAPEVVTPPRGYVHTKLFGKIGAGLSVVLLVVAGFFAVRVVRAFDTQFPVHYEQITESIGVTDAGCVWQVNVILRNESDERITVDRVETVLDRNIARAGIGEPPTLDPGETIALTAAWTLRNSDQCDSVADINHGNLIVRLDNGSVVSRGI